MASAMPRFLIFKQRNPLSEAALSSVWPVNLPEPSFFVSMSASGITWFDKVPLIQNGGNSLPEWAATIVVVV